MDGAEASRNPDTVDYSNRLDGIPAEKPSDVTDKTALLSDGTPSSMGLGKIGAQRSPKLPLSETLQTINRSETSIQRSTGICASGFGVFDSARPGHGSAVCRVALA